ncbi:MAG: dTMP kinase [Actinomycetota bacterium]|nr:dTMP kinase [Actinomycetota bacterium]
MPRPVYLAFEGTERCGKSTQSRRLAEHLGATLTRETGGTPVGERLRMILHDVDVMDLDSRAEALMIAADRAQHMARVVIPALDAGRDVVSDRSVYSTLAYQGYGRGVDLDELTRVNTWAVRGRWPDLVVLLDVPSDMVDARLADRDLDRFERENTEFHRRVRDGFHTMAGKDAERWIVIDATAEKDAVGRAIAAAVDERLRR